MAYKPLVGNEQLLVLGVQTNGMPAATTFHTTTGLIAGAPQVPLAGGATSSLTELNAGNLNLFGTAAGTVFTLPAATGSGVTFKFVVTTTVTSNSHKILPASVADFMQGVIATEDSGTMTGWAANVAATHSVAMNGTTTGGILGDMFTVTDVKSGVWQVNGVTQSSGTAATPFSTSLT